MRKKEEILAKELTAYVKNKHTQDECNGFVSGFEKAFNFADEQSVAFAEFLVKNYQPRFPNKGEWVKILDSNKFKTIYTTEQLLQIFKNENKQLW